MQIAWFMYTSTASHDTTYAVTYVCLCISANLVRHLHIPNLFMWNLALLLYIQQLIKLCISLHGAMKTCLGRGHAAKLCFLSGSYQAWRQDKLETDACAIFVSHKHKQFGWLHGQSLSLCTSRLQHILSCYIYTNRWNANFTGATTWMKLGTLHPNKKNS